MLTLHVNDVILCRNLAATIKQLLRRQPRRAMSTAPKGRRRQPRREMAPRPGRTPLEAELENEQKSNETKSEKISIKI